MASITLQQFEVLNGLRNRARADMDRRSYLTGQPIRPLLNAAQHQARLFDALIEALGYQAASEIDCLEDYADNLITDCLIGKVEVVDALAEAA